MKTILRLLTTKVFPRVNPHVSAEQSVLLKGAMNVLDPDGEDLHVAGLGSLSVSCSQALAFRCSQWKLLSNMRAAKSYCWKYVVKTQGRVWESPSAPYNLSQYASPIAVTWPTQDKLNCEVIDISGDVVIEFYSKTLSIPEIERPEKAVSDLFFGTRQESSDKEEWRRIQDCWTPYGKVIIPLASIVTYNKRVRQLRRVYPPRTPECADHTRHEGEGEIRNRKVFTTTSQTHSSHTRPTDHDLNTLVGWFHVYPISQQKNEDKYVRPMAGYPGVGMTNPKLSLGFVRVSIDLKLAAAGYKLALKSNLRPPLSTWTLPIKLDLQAFETSGSRLHGAFSQLPLWLKNILPFKTIYKPLVAGKCQWRNTAIPIVFWIVIWAVLVILPLWLLPIALFALFAGLSQPYWAFKYTKPDGTHFRSLHPLKSRQRWQGDKIRKLSDNVWAHAWGIRSSRAVNLMTWMNDRALSLRCPRDQTGEQFKREGYNIVSGDYGGAPPLTSRSVELTEQSCEPQINRLPTDEEVLNKSLLYPSLMYPRTPFHESSLGSPFGRLDVSIYDPQNYERVYSVFADDCATVDVYKMRHLGIVVLETVQLLFAVLSCTIEKLQYALNWTDPVVSRLTMIVLFGLSAQITSILYLLLCLPPAVLRMWVLFLPTFLVSLCVDSTFIDYCGLVDKLDALLVSLAEQCPGSHIVGRVCVDAWDLLYSTNLISWELRCSRIQELNDKANVKSTGGTNRSAPNYMLTRAGWFENILGTSPKRRGEELLQHTKLGEAINNARKWFPANGPANGSANGSATAEILPSKEDNRVDSSPSSEGDNKAPGAPLSLGATPHSPKISRVKIALQKAPTVNEPSFCFRQVLWILFGQWIVLELRFLVYWFCRLPDRREIEHRQICATQWLSEDLEDLLPNGTISDIDTFLEDVFNRVKSSAYSWEHTPEDQ